TPVYRDEPLGPRIAAKNQEEPCDRDGDDEAPERREAGNRVPDCTGRFQLSDGIDEKEKKHARCNECLEPLCFKAASNVFRDCRCSDSGCKLSSFRWAK